MAGVLYVLVDVKCVPFGLAHTVPDPRRNHVEEVADLGRHRLGV